MKAIVCGGRDYDDANALYAKMDALHAIHGFTLIIHGAAPGADSLGASWAHESGIPAKAYPAQWAEFGKAAGPMRNQQMLSENPGLVIAFQGGRGTADMVRRSQAAGIRVIYG